MRIPDWIYHTVIGASVVCILAAVVFYFVLTVRPAYGWSVAALSGTFENVDNLAFDPDGSLYATLKSKRNGQLIRILPGKTETLLAGLHNPDGLYHRRDYLYVTEEKKRDSRVISINLNNGETAVLAKLNRAFRETFFEELIEAACIVIDKNKLYQSSLTH